MTASPAPTFWEQNRTELLAVAALFAVAVVVLGILVAVYDEELDRFLRKVWRVTRREVLKRPLLAQFLL